MFLQYHSEQTVEQTLDWPVIGDAMTVIWRRRDERDCGYMYTVTGIICWSIIVLWVQYSHLIFYWHFRWKPRAGANFVVTSDNGGYI